MTFAAYQNELVEGKPIRLYEFKIGRYPISLVVGSPGYDTPAQMGHTVYRYCDADTNITLGVGGGDPVEWTGMPMTDKGITIAGQAQGDSYEVTLPIHLELAQRFRQLGPPSQTVALFIYEYHHSDPDQQAQPVWVGEVAEVSFPTSDTALFQCNTISAAFQRTGLRLSWGKQCPHVLYDAQCGLKLTDYLVTVNIVAILDGVTVQLDTVLDDTIYPGGMLVWIDPAGFVQTIGIESVAGPNVTLFGASGNLVGITELRAARGCKRNADACIALGNYNNFGGCPHLPEKSPFDGNPSFW